MDEIEVARSYVVRLQAKLEVLYHQGLITKQVHDGMDNDLQNIFDCCHRLDNRIVREKARNGPTKPPNA